MQERTGMIQVTKCMKEVLLDEETDEIRLYGLNGNDIFEVDDNVSSRIKLRIIGGKGNDTFNIKGNVRNFLYDVIDSVNVVKSHNRSKMRLSRTPSVNQFRWVDKQYTQIRFPRIVAGFNTDDGPLLGFGFWRRTYGFRKEPFASDNRISARCMLHTEVLTRLSIMVRSLACLERQIL